MIAAAIEAQDQGEFDDEAGAVAWMIERDLAPVGNPPRPSNRNRSQTLRWLRAHRPDRLE